MTDTIASRIDDALALEDDHELLEALDGLDLRYAMVAPPDRPAPLSWFGSVNYMYAMTDGQGISHYLSLDNDLDFMFTLESCRRLGAARTVAYLEAAAALYPGRVVPVSDHGRYRVVERLTTRARDTGAKDKLTAIDEKFADALPSLGADVRAWVVANRAELEETLRRIPAPVTPVPTELQTLEKALVSIQRMGETFHSARQKRLDAIAAEAMARGMLPWTDAGVDPRAASFYQATARFGEAEWLTVAERRLSIRRRFDAAESYVSNLAHELRGSELVPKVEFQASIDSHWKLRSASVAAARTMPKQVVVDGKKIGLLAGANDAIIATSICLAHHD